MRHTIITDHYHYHYRCHYRYRCGRRCRGRRLDRSRLHTTLFGSYVDARLRGAPEGLLREQLWEMHRQIYLFVEPDSTCCEIPVIEVMAGPGVSAAVTEHTALLRDHFAAFKA